MLTVVLPKFCRDLQPGCSRTLQRVPTRLLCARPLCAARPAWCSCSAAWPRARPPGSDRLEHTWPRWSPHCAAGTWPAHAREGRATGSQQIEIPAQIIPLLFIRAAIEDYFCCQLTYGLFFRLVIIIFFIFQHLSTCKQRATLLSALSTALQVQTNTQWLESNFIIQQSTITTTTQRAVFVSTNGCSTGSH